RRLTPKALLPQPRLRVPPLTRRLLSSSHLTRRLRPRPWATPPRARPLAARMGIPQALPGSPLLSPTPARPRGPSLMGHPLLVLGPVAASQKPCATPLSQPSLESESP